MYLIPVFRNRSPKTLTLYIHLYTESDRNVWGRVNYCLGVKLAATTAYHPQGDGQTERVNQELEQYLRLFINQRQDDWVELLSFAEFQYNNHIHSATQNIPFLLDTGRIPRMGFKPNQPRSHLE